jgi:hypothetical protein
VAKAGSRSLQNMARKRPTLEGFEDRRMAVRVESRVRRKKAAVRAAEVPFVARYTFGKFGREEFPVIESACL